MMTSRVVTSCVTEGRNTATISLTCARPVSFPVLARQWLIVNSANDCALVGRQLSGDTFITVTSAVPLVKCYGIVI